jgi:DME family drug/metabolite transporter
LLGSEQVITTAPNPARGNLVAASSGVAWALTMTGFRWLGRRARSSESTLAAVIFGNLCAFAGCLPLALPARRMAFADVAVLVYLGVFQVALAYIALARSIRSVPALEAAVLLLIEPVFNPVWSWLVHGERPSDLTPPLGDGDHAAENA